MHYFTSILRAGCFFLAAALLLTNVSHGDTLDQVSAPGDLTYFVNEDQDLAQTFTVGIPGQLTQFDVYISREATTTDDLIIDIRQLTGAGGSPTEADAGGNILATIVATAGSVSTTASWHSFDISADSVFVSGGEEYAITMRSDDDDAVGYSWLAQPADPYAGGSVYQRFGATWQDDPFTKSVDLPFRTFVAVPEPASTIVIASLALVGLRRRRRV